MRLSALVPVPVVLAASLLAGCASNDGRILREPSPGQTTPSVPDDGGLDDGSSALAVSGAWEDGGAIAGVNTCDGANLSPALVWSGGPPNVAAWAVVLTDEDAPGHAHWVVANLSPETRSLAEGTTDPLAVEATNSSGGVGYSGPCPPKGTTHTYSLAVYALSQVLEAQSGDPAAGLLAAIEASAMEMATSTFTYGR